MVGEEPVYHFVCHICPSCHGNGDVEVYDPHADSDCNRWYEACKDCYGRGRRLALEGEACRPCEDAMDDPDGGRMGWQWDAWDLAADDTAAIVVTDEDEDGSP